MRTRASITGWKRAAVTAVVAYALVLQALLLSFGGALHAAAAQAPQAIVCAQGGESGSDRQPGDPHDALCCVLNCHGSAPAGPAPASAAFERLPPVAAAVELSSGTPFLKPTSHVLPLGPRAPPHSG